MATLEDAILLAAEAHRGQVDKAGQPYILHPLRVMLRLRSPREMMADLRAAGYPEEVVEAVDHLTRRAEESYEQFVGRAAQHPLARNVKLADLEDNLDIRRLPQLQEKDVARLKRYRRAWGQLTGEH